MPEAVADDQLTLVEHLQEFRSRVFKSLILIVITTCGFYNSAQDVIALFVKPIGKVVFIAPQEAFITNIKMSVFGGLFLASPFVFYQIWKFISVALNAGEKKYILLFAPASFVFFIAGVSFGYFIIVPIGLTFLLSFSSEVLSPMISVSKYITFVGTLLLSFGMVFQLPLIVLFLAKLGIITSAGLSSKRRYAIVIIFIVAALLTPPDVVTQCLMAGPLILLYEIGIIFAKFASKPK